jgi:hypothetical protein
MRCADTKMKEVEVHAWLLPASEVRTRTNDRQRKSAVQTSYIYSSTSNVVVR